MTTPTNHVFAGPYLHRVGLLALWGFLQDFSAKYREDQRKSYDLSAGPAYCIVLAGTAPYYGKSSPG